MAIVSKQLGMPGKIAAAALTIIGAVIALEGGYVNHKNDPGGETNMGVTVQVARANGYTGPMRTLPREVATSIYYRRYLVEPGLEPMIALDAAVTEELFDTTVNMGPQRPSRWFQMGLNELCVAGISVDGKIGGQSVGAFAACQKKLGATTLCRSMLDRLDARQKAEYRRLVRVNANLGVFYNGWIAHRIGNVDRKKCGRA